MNVLSLDTATEVLALSAATDASWASMSVRRGLQHSPALLPLAEGLLKELGMTVKDLELIVCSIGPGSFTGIRIGLATAMGIGHGRGIPVVGVSTLDALGRAWGAHAGDVFPVIDARKGNIYTARYRGGERQGAYQDVSPAALARMVSEAQSPLLAGEDAAKIRDLLGDAWRTLALADAIDPRSLLRLGIEAFDRHGVDATGPRPLYLRKSEAESARQKEHGVDGQE